jgi:hypothetical protein
MSLKNTYYVILLLSVFAALIVGLNIGKKMQQTQKSLGQTQTTKPEESPTSTPVLFDTTNGTSSPSGMTSQSSQSGLFKNATPSGTTLKGTLYTNNTCGISFTYPSTVTAEESSTQTQGAVFTNKANPKDIVVLTCQKDIPKPPLSAQNIENFPIGNITGKLYHDTSGKDGTQVDALLFTNPKTTLDVFIGGYGATFNVIIQSLKIL